MLIHRGSGFLRQMLVLGGTVLIACGGAVRADAPSQAIGRETAIKKHLQDDEEFTLKIPDLIAYGQQLFTANWTVQDGAGRPQTKGTGRPLSDPSDPLVGARSFNRISGPDASSCQGCHNEPFGLPGGAGDFAGTVFVLAQRFDFVTFDAHDTVPTKGSLDERGKPVSLSNLANLRRSPSLFGAGYIEMLAREMTDDLQVIRDGMKGGESRALISKGVSFGQLTRRPDGTWDVSHVVGLPRFSILTTVPLDPPTLVVRPWHQAANVISLREFTNTAMSQHHGIQTTERFGVDTDPDGDGHKNEMTRADVTAISLWQATLQVPGQVIPRDAAVAAAIRNGEKVFAQIKCAGCHRPALPLGRQNWIYSEPNPYNTPGNLRVGETRSLTIDLNSASLPAPRLKPEGDSQWLQVPAYTDLKLHDITNPTEDLGAEPLDQNQGVWAQKFVAGNRRFLTKRLWGCGNSPPYFHHGLFTTLREAVLGHYGEALESRTLFQRLTEYDQDSLIEFLKSLQVLPAGTRDLIVDETFHPVS